MRTSHQHAGKSSDQRAEYIKNLNARDVEPTIDERLVVDRSSDSRRTNATAIPKPRRRPAGFSSVARSHLRDNWIKYVITIVIGIILYFTTSFSRDLGAIYTKLDELKDDIKQIRFETATLNTKVYEIDMQILRQKLKIEEIETKFK